MSEQLDSIKNSLLACAMNQMSDLEKTDAKELGEVIDMIKDIEEAKYYCKITKAMDERSTTDKTQEKIDTALMMERLKNQSDIGSKNYYEERRGYPYMYYPERGYDERYYDGSSSEGRMYYDGRDRRRGGYTERSYSQPMTQTTTTVPSSVRDYREGRSYMGRRGYMESKENHMADSYKMEKLEEYAQQLDEDIVEMTKDATPQEKTAIRDRLTKIAQKLV